MTKIGFGIQSNIHTVVYLSPFKAFDNATENPRFSTL